jgi:hypothetical protein
LEVGWNHLDWAAGAFEDCALSWTSGWPHLERTSYEAVCGQIRGVHLPDVGATFWQRFWSNEDTASTEWNGQVLQSDCRVDVGQSGSIVRYASNKYSVDKELAKYPGRNLDGIVFVFVFVYATLRRDDQAPEVRYRPYLKWLRSFLPRTICTLQCRH